MSQQKTLSCIITFIFLFLAALITAQTPEFQQQDHLANPDQSYIQSFRADPNIVRPGQSIIIKWNVSGTGRIDLFVGDTLKLSNLASGVNGFSFIPSESTTVTLKIKEGARIVDTATLNIEVETIGSKKRSPTSSKAKIFYFTITPDKVQPGKPTMARWHVEGDCVIKLESDDKRILRDGSPPGTGFLNIFPQRTTRYTLSLIKDGQILNSLSRTAHVLGGAGEPPVIESFRAFPFNAQAGQEVTLKWKVKNATSVYIRSRNSGSRELMPSSSFGYSTRRISPTQTDQYTLTAINEYGEVTSRITVRVK